MLQIHNMFYGYGGTDMLLSDTVNSIVTWISLPSLYISLFVAIVSFFEKKMNKKFIFFTFVSLIFYIIGNASRIMLIIIVAGIFVSFLYYNVQVSKKIRKRIKKICLIFILSFLILTVIRKSGSASSSSKVNSLYAYLSIPIALLDRWIEIFDNNPVSIHTYGGSFFYGVISWINWFTSKIGFDLHIYNQVYQYVLDTQEVWFKVFPQKSYNAFCTMFYYFYLDFGWIGVFGESLIFGWISNYVYKKMTIYNEKGFLLYYMLIIQCILFSFVRWTPSTASFIVELVALKFILKKNEVKNWKA